MKYGQKLIQDNMCYFTIMSKLEMK